MLKPNLFHPSHLASALFLVAQLGDMPGAYAQEQNDTREIPQVSDSAERKIIEHMQETNLSRLHGWPGMIFYCPTEEAKSSALKQICLESYKNLETLAVQNEVKFHKARNANDVALLPHLTGRLKLVIELTGTESIDPSAITAHIAVLAHYAHAVNRSAELTTQDSDQVKHPLSVPQHVDAVLWEATIVKAAAGGQDALVQPVVQAINEKLKAFFADYAKANR
ncbi:MAG: hypothetical protein PHE55_00395 [Methylococcaceae bacterium]|nr:hypothetical protein [Methylococcaceae bacterium]